MQVVVFGEGSGDNEMGGGGVQEKTLDDADFRGLLGQIDIYMRVSTGFAMIRWSLNAPDEPSMSAGLSRSIRRIRPVESANIRTLFATAAATKSEDMLNCRDTRSMLNMGRDASSCILLVLGGAYPLDMSYAILGFGVWLAAIVASLSYFA